MDTVIADTILVSDLHLGSETSRAREAAQFLHSAMFNRLILLGDIFCDLNFRRLKKEHWQFLSLIRKLSNPKRGVEVVWVEGNHDRGLAQLMSHLVGVRVYDDYGWQYRGVKYRGIHGHQFDRFLVDSALLSALGELIYLHIQKVDFKDSKIARWFDRKNSRWLRLTETAHRLLRRLDQNDAHLIFQPTHGHFYFGLGMAIVDAVREVTVDALVRPGLIVRDKATTTPIDSHQQQG